MCILAQLIRISQYRISNDVPKKKNMNSTAYISFNFSEIDSIRPALLQCTVRNRGQYVTAEALPPCGKSYVHRALVCRKESDLVFSK